MDIDKFIAGKATGASKVELHGETTLLISWPGGFDPDTGAALPPKEQGFQPADIYAMRNSAAQSVETAENALNAARTRLSAFDELLADPVVSKASETVAAASEKIV